MHLLENAAVISNEAGGIEEAMEAVLNEIAAQLGWAIGHAYISESAGSEVFVDAGAWSDEAKKRIRPAGRAARLPSVRRGEGLIGRVAESGESEWIDVYEDELPYSPRRLRAAKVRPRSAFALPVKIGPQVEAVLAFLTPEDRPPDAELMEVLTQVGTQLGRVVERVRNEKKLRESEEGFRLLVEGLRDHALYSLDTEGRIASWNVGAQRIHGYAAEEIVGRHFSCLFPPEEDPDKLAAREMKIAAEEGMFHQEGWRLRKDRTRFWAEVTLSPLFDDRGKLCGYAKITRDITHQMRAKAALRESEARFRTVFRDAAMGMAILDLAGHILVVNPAFRQILGHEELELLHHHFRDFTHPDDLEVALRLHRELMDCGRREYKTETRYIRKNGETIWTLLTVSVVCDEEDQPLYAVAMIQDISERKKLEKDLAEAALAEQQRLGQELHDGLGQQLTALGMMAVTLERRLKRKLPEEAEPLARLSENLKEAHQQVRSLSKGLHPVSVDANGLIDAIEQFVNTTRELSGVPIEFQCDDPVHLQDTNLETQLYFIVQEALRNAVHHSGADLIKVALESKEPHLVFMIEDNGRGIWEKNKRADGMGLRIMRHRAGLIGAELGVESGREGGTRVICKVKRRENHGQCQGEK